MTYIEEAISRMTQQDVALMKRVCKRGPKFPDRDTLALWVMEQFMKRVVEDADTEDYR